MFIRYQQEPLQESSHVRRVPRLPLLQGAPLPAWRIALAPRAPLTCAVSPPQLKYKAESVVASSLIPDVSKNERTTLAANPAPPGAPSFDHSVWDAVLKAHLTPGAEINEVRGVTTVDYQGIANDPRFSEYIAALGKADLSSLPVAERLALWINAYNALCIHLIVEQEKLRGSPVKSINDISTKASHHSQLNYQPRLLPACPTSCQPHAALGWSTRG